MTDAEILEEKLKRYYAQPYTPPSRSEAATWERASGCEIISHEEASELKAQIQKIK